MGLEKIYLTLGYSNPSELSLPLEKIETMVGQEKDAGVACLFLCYLLSLCTMIRY